MTVNSMKMSVKRSAKKKLTVNLSKMSVKKRTKKKKSVRNSSKKKMTVKMTVRKMSVNSRAKMTVKKMTVNSRSKMIVIILKWMAVKMILISVFLKKIVKINKNIFL